MNQNMYEKATVMAVHRERYELLAENEKLFGKLKTANFYNGKEGVAFPTVGDEVSIIYNENGDSLITDVLPRKSVFMRLNATQGLPDQAVAANFDYVFITMSLNRDFNLSKLERYLTVSWQSGGIPVIVLTKADLCEDKSIYLEQIYSVAVGVEVFCISSVTGEGIADMEHLLGTGKTAVLLGSSGVGKSSLTNVLVGKDEMLTGGIREADAQGRHTTTYKQCIYLPKEIKLPDGNVIKGGGRIIDTPGMRKLIISEAEQGMQNSFEDIEELVNACKFSDCKHKTEPGCEVRKALEMGTLSEKRWRTYQAVLKEEAFAKERQKIVQRRMDKLQKNKIRKVYRGIGNENEI